jgi:hypothetical protein
LGNGSNRRHLAGRHCVAGLVVLARRKDLDFKLRQEPSS